MKVLGSGLVAEALEAALESVTGEEQDSAARELARKYAKAIDDDPEALWRVGPKLLDVLIELRMTPRARAGVIGGGSANGGSAGDKLDELKRRRENRATNMDAPA